MKAVFLTLVVAEAMIVDVTVKVHVEGHSILANTWALQAHYCWYLEEVVMGPTAQHSHRVDIKADHLEKLTLGGPDVDYRCLEQKKSH